MVAATLAVFLVPLAFGEELTEALLRAMTFMIVASPCAVVPVPRQATLPVKERRPVRTLGVPP